jgi:hypothetical protein
MMFGLILISIGTYSQNSSPLQQGKWIKVAVTQPGFYHINPAWFAKNKISPPKPESICIYGSQSGMINARDIENPGTLKAIPAFYQNSKSVDWDIMFFGDGPHSLKQNAVWEQETNRYVDTSFYFIQIDAAKTNPIEEILNKTAVTPYVPFAWSLKHYEPETFNLLQSGRIWLGDAFYGSSNKFLQYSLPDYFDGKPAHIQLKLYASSTGPSTFSIPSLAKSITIDPIPGGRYDIKARSQTISTRLTPTLTNKNWSFPIQFQTSGGTGYIDYISFLYPKSFDAKHANPLYLLPNSKDSTLNISIANLTASQQIWINNGGTLWKKMANNLPFQYVFKSNSQLAIADPNSASEPSFCGNVSNQNLIDTPAETELIVLSAPALQAAAIKLARYKTEKRNIKSISISTSAIYNEFSGGKQDVTAIRNFIRNQFQKSGSKLRYILLLGDASIDYKGLGTISTAIEKSCFVPTYQSQESFQPLLSYASDDYYGIVGERSGDWEEGFLQNNYSMEVAIGRIPVKNPQEANMFINKLMDYEAQSRSVLPQLAWVSDDGDANIHMQDGEDFSSTLENALFPGQQHKVYLDQYPMQQVNGAYSSPIGTQAVLSLFNEKADFIHYMGHGSESGWADEKLLTTNDLLNLKNNKHLPILLTATCQFGRFDDPNILSGGEVGLLSDQGGVIALISTTRPVFQSSNYLFGQAFYQALLKNKERTSYRLGDLFKDAKNQSQSGVINRNIQLLGDPTLALPWSAETLQLEVDSIQQQIIIKGIKTKDEPVNIHLHRMSDVQKTLGTKNDAFQYQTMSPIIWKLTGSSSSSPVRLSLKNLPNLTRNQRYQIQVSSKTASAATSINSWHNKQASDQIGPGIRIELPEENIQKSSPNPWVVVTVTDSSGLKWQSATGKTASAMLDDSIKIDLAPIAMTTNNSSKVAKARFQLKSLAKGNHKIQVICWDTYNNQAEASLTFQVSMEDENSILGRVYPNPLGKTFHFVFEQKKPWNTMPFELQLINLQGQILVRKTGLSRYQDNENGIIEFDWNDDELMRLNQPLILQIFLQDEIEKKNKVFRIKTSALK